jgi:hypothetical protein
MLTETGNLNANLIQLNKIKCLLRLSQHGIASGLPAPQSAACREQENRYAERR